MLEDRTAAAPLTGRQPAPTPTPWPAAYPQGYAVVDVETTGLARDDRIVSAAVYRLDARGDVEDHWYTTVNPQRDPGPVWIHGLTSAELADAPLFPEIAEELAARLDGRVLVAHNAVFDWSMIAREFARAGTGAPVRQRLCTIVLAKELGLPLPNHKLESLAAHYGVVQQRAHHALDDARVLAEAFRPSLHLAAGSGVALPLHACRPLTEWTDNPVSGPVGRQASYRPRTWRPSRRRPACPYPNPGRYEPGGPLVQGMRVAFSGDTSVDRELLEDRATEAGLHVAGSVSRLTSLLVTNDPDSATSKVVKARAAGTPVIDEAAFTQLLQDVAPQSDGARRPDAPPEQDGPPRPDTSPGPEESSSPDGSAGPDGAGRPGGAARTVPSPRPDTAPQPDTAPRPDAFPLSGASWEAAGLFDVDPSPQSADPSPQSGE